MEETTELSSVTYFTQYCVSAVKSTSMEEFEKKTFSEKYNSLGS